MKRPTLKQIRRQLFLTERSVSHAWRAMFNAFKRMRDLSEMVQRFGDNSYAPQLWDALKAEVAEARAQLDEARNRWPVWKLQSMARFLGKED